MCLVLPFSFVFLGLWIWALIDCAQNHRLIDSQKTMYLLLIIFLPFIGSILYLAIGRNPKPSMMYPPYYQPPQGYGPYQQPPQPGYGPPQPGYGPHQQPPQPGYGPPQSGYGPYQQPPQQSQYPQAHPMQPIYNPPPQQGQGNRPIHPQNMD